jgi:hypothetical protein
LEGDAVGTPSAIAVAECGVVVVLPPAHRTDPKGSRWLLRQGQVATARAGETVFVVHD